MAGPSVSFSPRNKRHFLEVAAPSGYVAGVESEATRLTNQSDIELARYANVVSDDEHAPPAKRMKRTEEEKETDTEVYSTGFQSMMLTDDDCHLALRRLVPARESHSYRSIPMWIVCARLIEETGDVEGARTFIMVGCEQNPTSEDLWLEAVRIQPPDAAKTIMSQALRHIPTSVQIWMKVADLETDMTAKRRVYRKALEKIPNSVRLWKAAVESVGPSDARILLSRAVECCPTSTDLWLALARLETYDNAKTVLNKARENIPTDRQIWIAAAKLEEANGKKHMVKKIIDRAVLSLSENGVEFNREHWFKEAMEAEKAGAVHCCQVIIGAIVDFDIKVGRIYNWMEDAETCAQQGAFECARTVYAYALAVFPSAESIWLKAVCFEETYGTRETLLSLVRRGITRCPKSIDLWIRSSASVLACELLNEIRNLDFEYFQNILTATAELAMLDSEVFVVPFTLAQWQ